MNLTSKDIARMGGAARAALLAAQRERPTVAPASLAARVVVDIPIKLVNESNTREHHFSRASRTKREIQAVYQHLGWRVVRTGLALPVAVTFTRLIGPRGRRMDEPDGVWSCLKHIKDGVALIFGADDADPGYRWALGDPAQVRHEWHGVRIVVEAMQ